jgi:hypothetical protein
MNNSDIAKQVDDALATQPVLDMHTHLFAPAFGSPVPNATGKTDPAGLLLWGIDELVTYHYLVAEVYRVVPATTLPYETFWKMSKTEQADHIWKHLFVERTPISEACRGVLTTLQKLGLNPKEKTLDPYRKFFAAFKPTDYIDRVMELSNVKSITMTNEVFDENEHQRWMKDPTVGVDPRFKPVLRIDAIIRDWPSAAKRLSGWGYTVGSGPDAKTVEETKRFLREWIARMKAIYVAVSLPPEFRFPCKVNDPVKIAGEAMIQQAILPVCAEHGIPFAMMIGSRQQVNPGLRAGGDMSGLADINTVATLCQQFPKNKFFVTMLSRENQHELAVVARKFGNLMVFGCWWFLNNPSIIEEMTRFRLELLGTTFIPQHSDARILDQLLYKWDHSRAIIGTVLKDQYAKINAAGWPVGKTDIEKDVCLLLHDNFANFLAR